ncbi:hypothetical protein [Paraliomyxa miuraensis]|uniref:hypothetical protein n=1 Tax=Paraliomyxa miuraensis TaxID=376150 RepID=UPI00225A4EE9|nr:hypothetical protein [Paraliomyxa miuraensis]MCX4241345.1 hypothetical protein [Paraliomyxa miuraensis]
MLSSLHEILVELLRRSPGLLRHYLGDRLPPLADEGLTFDTDHNRGSNVIEVGKDLVLKVVDRTGNLLCALVIEVQLARDDAKARTWALYAAWAHYRLRCPVHVVVLALDRTVAEWAAGPFCIGDMTLRPWVIGPEQIEPITSVDEARKSIELAFISGMAHRDSPIAADVGRALWRALASKEHEHGDLIWDIYISFIDTELRRTIEMELSNWKPQSDWGRRLYEEGQQDGEARGEARALLTILETRGMGLTNEQIERVESCRDVGRLDAWLRRAATATTATEIFDGA